MTASRPPLTSELQLTCIVIGKMRRGKKTCMPVGRQENGTGSRAPCECDRRLDPSGATRCDLAAPIAPELLQIEVPQMKRAQGMPGDRLTRSSACKNRKHADKSTTGSPKQSGIPCAMVLRLPSCSPRRPGFFVSVIGAMRSIAANLTSASGYQDPTTSPSAVSPLVSRQHRVHRIPRPTFVTIAKRPSYRVQDARASKGDLPDGASVKKAEKPGSDQPRPSGVDLRMRMLGLDR
jgi:hypothetical protein